MNNKGYIALLKALLCAGIVFSFNPVVAQVDSVMLTGIVLNNDTRKPYPDCILRLVQQGHTVVETQSDEEGNFFIAALPVGSYELHVRIKNFTIHQADLTLDANADLTVAVDTLIYRTLKSVTITATKHMLGSLQITSRHDKRLWGFNAGYRDANASVALPPDAHENIDYGPEDEETGEHAPVFPYGMPWRVQVAYITGKLGTTLRTPPIWELVPDRKYVADSTKTTR